MVRSMARFERTKTFQIDTPGMVHVYLETKLDSISLVRLVTCVGLRRFYNHQTPTLNRTRVEATRNKKKRKREVKEGEDDKKWDGKRRNTPKRSKKDKGDVLTVDFRGTTHPTLTHSKHNRIEYIQFKPSNNGGPYTEVMVCGRHS